MKFFKCSNEALVIPVCNCYTNQISFEGITEISSNTVEASKEKHMPVVSINENIVTVNIGSVAHPMTEEHSITTVILETNNGGQYKFLLHHGDPVVHFSLAKDEKAVAAYAYCNLHGLWKADID